MNDKVAADSVLIFPPSLDSVRDALAGHPAFLVGGAVRDAILGRVIHDLDFAIPKNGIKTARKVADALKAAFYPLDEERDTGRVLIPQEGGLPLCLDFATYRGKDLEEDLRGRDFTMNAIAYDIHSGEVIDPLKGGQDLKDKKLRLCSATAIADDPVRILRGVRLAADFGFLIPGDVYKAMKSSVAGLLKISPERLRDEFFRILEGGAPAACIRALDLFGVLDNILPELRDLRGLEQPEPHVNDAWEHTLAVLGRLEGILDALHPEYDPEKGSDLLNGLLVLRIGRYRAQIAQHLKTQNTPARSRRGLLFLEALYHDVAKPRMKTVEDGRIRFLGHDREGAEIVKRRAQALALSNEEIHQLDVTISNHMRILSYTNRLIKEGHGVSRRSVYRFFRDTGETGVEVCLLALADMRSTYEQTIKQEEWAACLEVVRTLLENWFERPEESVKPPVLVDGNDLMRELGIEPGPKVGELLEMVREAQAAGEVSTRDQVLELARKNLDDSQEVIK